jgi:hypothetical protein
VTQVAAAAHASAAQDNTIATMINATTAAAPAAAA